MHRLGFTRSSLKHDHLLQTPDTFIHSPLNGATGVDFIIHAAPQLGADFTQLTAEFAPNGTLAPAPAQRFLYILEGELTLEAPQNESVQTHSLTPGSFAYIPEATPHTVRAVTKSRAAIFEKPYELSNSAKPPQILIGNEADIPSAPILGDESIRVRPLLPDSPAYDFAINTMTYDPGAALPMVEVHLMEHGLLMLEGGGIYRLGDNWYPVQAGDFIWMAPYCPQWFGALGKQPAKYLLYKDWRRHPLGE
jgi:(S)-ureidoglycine aminohydrolase